MNKYRPLFLVVAWAICSGAYAQKFGDPNAIVNAMEIQTKQQRLFAVVNNTTVELWNYKRRELITRGSLDSRGVGLAIGLDRIAVAKIDGTVDLFKSENLERVGGVKVTDGIIVRIKSYPDGSFVIGDDRGSIYRSSPADNGSRFERMLTVSAGVGDFDFIAEQDLFVVGDVKGNLSLWSATGHNKIGQGKFGARRYVAMQYDSTTKFVCATTKSGRIDYYTTKDSTLFLMDRERIMFWGAGLDYVNGVTATGSINGKVRVDVLRGVYKARDGAMINSIKLIPDYEPIVYVIIGTHGNGMRIISAMDMKLPDRTVP